jgi:hypothetical protein
VEERRRYPRAEISIAMRSGGPGGAVEELRSVNLSAGGVCYESPVWVEPYTRLEMMFVFPPQHGARDARERVVEAGAVVVWTDPERQAEAPRKYKVACTFTSIAASDREFIARYVDSALARGRVGNPSDPGGYM